MTDATADGHVNPPESGPSPAALDYSALAALFLGHFLFLGLVAVTAWLLGVALLRTSRTWAWPQKVLGVLALPGLLALVVYASLVQGTFVYGGVSDTVAIAYLVAVAAVYGGLAGCRMRTVRRWRARHPEQRPASCRSRRETLTHIFYPA